VKTLDFDWIVYNIRR